MAYMQLVYLYIFFFGLKIIDFHLKDEDLVLFHHPAFLHHMCILSSSILPF